MTRDQLLRWMRREGVTQGALAEALGVHLTTVNRWVKGTPVAQGAGEDKRPKPLALPKWLPFALGIERLDIKRRD